MLGGLLICALALGAPTVEQPTEVDAAKKKVVTTQSTNEAAASEQSLDYAVAAEQAKSTTDAASERFWARKKALRLGYEWHCYQNEYGGELANKWSVGLSNAQSIWLHKRPIASRIKFGLDLGPDINYINFKSTASADGYKGPSGYVGTDTAQSGIDLPYNVSSMGSHYLSVGCQIGPSLTIRPVAQMRIVGYAYFVPSVAVQFSGASLNLGFMPYLKYGCELSYDWFGVGVEWGTGVSNMSDFASKIISGNSSAKATKAKFYSNYMRAFISFRLGKAKR